MYYNYITLKQELKHEEKEISNFETLIEVESGKQIKSSSDYEKEPVDGSQYSNDKIHNITLKILDLKNDLMRHVERYQKIKEAMHDIKDKLKINVDIIDRIFYYKYVEGWKTEWIINRLPFGKSQYYRLCDKLTAMIIEQKIEYEEIINK